MKTRQICVGILFLFIGCSDVKIITRSEHGKSVVTINDAVLGGINIITVSGRANHAAWVIFLASKSGTGYCTVEKNVEGSQWFAVTDTIPKPRFFGHYVPENNIKRPIEFIPISNDEIYYLEQGANLPGFDQGCDKSFRKVIGFIKTRL